MALEPPTGTWSTDRLRTLFLDYFKEKGSHELPSSSLVPQDDPTVLLTTAGMQQMIPVPAGAREPPSRRSVLGAEVLPHDRHRRGRQPTHADLLRDAGQLLDRRLLQGRSHPVGLGVVDERLGLARERLWITIHPSDDEAREIWLADGYPGRSASYDLRG